MFKVCIRSKWPNSSRTYPGFFSMKRLEIIDEMETELLRERNGVYTFCFTKQIFFFVIKGGKMEEQRHRTPKSCFPNTLVFSAAFHCAIHASLHFTHCYLCQAVGI